MRGKRRIREMRDGVLYISCTKCDGMFPDASFGHRVGKNGNIYAYPWCKECNSKHNSSISASKYAKVKGVSIISVLEQRAREEANRIEQAQLRKEVEELFGGIDNIPDSKYGGYQVNICIDCQNACGDCSWSAIDYDKPGKPIKFKPIPDWDAELVYKKSDGKIIKTYSIKHCPQFVPDERRETSE